MEIQQSNQAESEQPIKTCGQSMIWLSVSGDYIQVKCPQCGKESRIKLSAGQYYNYTGYKLHGEGKCSCGFCFDQITKIAPVHNNRVQPYFSWGGACFGFLIGLVEMAELSARIHSNNMADNIVAGGLICGKWGFIGSFVGGGIGWMVDAIRGVNKKSAPHIAEATESLKEAESRHTIKAGLLPSERMCEVCGKKYSLSDYTHDAREWFCPDCKNPLPQE
jgi:hypothetical protein